MGGLEDGEGAVDTAETLQRMKEEELQVRRVQEWWGSEADGPALARQNPIFAALERSLVAELIAAGGGYHTILSADRLDGLHRQFGGSTDPAMEPLKKALQARGGLKSQARAVGMLLFKEARMLLEGSGPALPQSLVASLPTPARASPTASPRQPSASPRFDAGAQTKQLEEVFAPPQRFVCSEAYPPGALMAARAAPDPKSEVVAKLPSDFEYVVSGRVAGFLEVQVELNGAPVRTYVPQSIGGQTLLVPAPATQGGVVLDEVWQPPRRWVRAEGFPEGAQMAAKAEPSTKSQQLATLPCTFEYMATGRVGDYLQVALDTDSGETLVAYVLHTLGQMVLLKPAPTQAVFQAFNAPCGSPTSASSPVTALPPALASPPLPAASAAPSPRAPPPVASPRAAAPAAEAPLTDQQSQRILDAAATARAAAEAATSAAAAARAASDLRVDALESKVAMQEQQIKALQAELAQLRGSLATAASALAAAAGCAPQAQ